jgi:hypothetical protein
VEEILLKIAVASKEEEHNNQPHLVQQGQTKLLAQQLM